MKNPRIVAASVLFVILAGFPAHAEVMLIGKKVSVSTGFMACKNVDDLNKVKKLPLAHDAEAAAKYAEANGCVALDTGTVGVVEDLSVWSNANCIRLKGEPECVWMPAPFLASAE